MRITVNGTPHQVDFRHLHFMSTGRRYATQCWLDAVPRPKGEWLPPTGQALCSRKDTFRKATGRKVALARALKAKGYHKAWRTAFWVAYFTQAKQ